MTHASENWFVAALIALFTAIILFRILTAQRGDAPYIRRIPGLNAIDEAIGRSTEMGKPVMMVPGIGTIGDALTTVPTLQAVSILAYIAKAVAKLGNRVIVPTIDPVLTGIVEEVMRDAYQSAGRADLFHAEDIRYLSDQQFAFASGVAGIISREKVAANFMFGPFFAESLILAEVGQREGAIQVAGTNERTQIPFFIASCDYVIIGDEFYAASAYLSRDPTLLGSIVAQDYCKLIMIVLTFVGIAAASIAQFAHPGLLDVHMLDGTIHHIQTMTVPHFIVNFCNKIIEHLTPGN